MQSWKYQEEVYYFHVKNSPRWLNDLHRKRICYFKTLAGHKMRHLKRFHGQSINNHYTLAKQL